MMFDAFRYRTKTGLWSTLSWPGTHAWEKMSVSFGAMPALTVSSMDGSCMTVATGSISRWMVNTQLWRQLHESLPNYLKDRHYDHNAEINEANSDQPTAANERVRDGNLPF